VAGPEILHAEAKVYYYSDSSTELSLQGQSSRMLQKGRK